MTVSAVPPKLRTPLYWYGVAVVAIALAVAAGNVFFR
jgi:hypothetical protein